MGESEEPFLLILDLFVFLQESGLLLLELDIELLDIADVILFQLVLDEQQCKYAYITQNRYRQQ